MGTKWEVKKITLGNAIIGGVVALIVGVLAGLGWHKYAPSFLPYLGFDAPVATHDWSSLDEVYAELVTNYDGEIDETALVEGAKKGLVEAVGDVYTAYMDADEAAEFNASLHGDSGAGIGVEISLRDSYVRVIRTLPDNPARTAGMKAGDIIYKVDGEDVLGESLDAVSAKLRGQPGTKVKVTVIRDDAEKDFEITRETINNVSAYLDFDGSTAIVTVTRFDNDTGTVVQKMVADEFKDKDIKKVILDLRNNTGGYVSAARDLLSLWIDNQDILIQKNRGETTDIETTARGKAKLANIPTVVLVNGSTASASEIVAGALKDYDKATILGETTFGKGVVQTLFDLPGGALLKITTAHWYTPKGISVSDNGITPDITVELTYDDTNHNRDPQMDAAKKLDLTKTKEEK